jgi:hypothetical protein
VNGYNLEDQTTYALSARTRRNAPRSHRTLYRVFQQVRGLRQAHEVRQRPDRALFRTDQYLSGILKCAVCQELFITATHIRSTAAELFAEGRPTKWLGTPEAEDARRRRHADAHGRNGEAILDATTGFFLLSERLRPTPRAVTAADFGF